MHPPIPVLKSVAGLRHFLQTQRANLQSNRQCDRPLRQISLVPTMVALHQEHQSLIQRARQENAIASGGMGFGRLHDGGN